MRGAAAPRGRTPRSPDHRSVAVWEVRDEFGDVRLAGRGQDLIVGRVEPAVAGCLSAIVPLKSCLLGTSAIAPRRSSSECRDIEPIEGDAAAWASKARHEVHDRLLAGRWADQCDRFAVQHFGRKVASTGAAVRTIGEADRLEATSDDRGSRTAPADVGFRISRSRIAKTRDAPTNAVRSTQEIENRSSG